MRKPTRWSTRLVASLGLVIALIVSAGISSPAHAQELPVVVRAVEALEPEAASWFRSVGPARTAEEIRVLLTRTGHGETLLVSNSLEGMNSGRGLRTIDVTRVGPRLEGPIDRLLYPRGIQRLPRADLAAIEADFMALAERPAVTTGANRRLLARIGSEVLPTRTAEIAGEGISNLVEFRPRLLLRRPSVELLGAMRRLGARPFARESVRVLPLIDNTDTLRRLSSSLAANQLPLAMSEASLRGALESQRGNLVLALGHIEDGMFASPNGFRIHVSDLIDLGREYGVTIFPFGCNSVTASGSVGTTAAFNSLEAIDRIAEALASSTVGEFFERIAAPSNGRAELVLVVDESTFVAGGETIRVYRLSPTVAGGTTLAAVGVLLIPDTDRDHAPVPLRRVESALVPMRPLPSSPTTEPTRVTSASSSLRRVVFGTVMLVACGVGLALAGRRRR